MLSKIFSLWFACFCAKRVRDPGCVKASKPLFSHLKAAALCKAQEFWHPCLLCKRGCLKECVGGMYSCAGCSVWHIQDARWCFLRHSSLTDLKVLWLCQGEDEPSAEKSPLHVQVAMTSIALNECNREQEKGGSEPHACYEGLIDISPYFPRPLPQKSKWVRTAPMLNWSQCHMGWKDILSSSFLVRLGSPLFQLQTPDISHQESSAPQITPTQ